MSLRILLIFVILISVSCNQHKSAPKGYDERNEILPNPEGYKRDTFYFDTTANKTDLIMDSLSKP